MHACGKALLGKLVQISDRILAVGAREFWQIQRVKIKFDRAAVGNPDRIFKCALILSEQHAHLARILVVKLVRFKADRATVLDRRVGLNAHQYCLGGGVSTAQIMAVVGGHYAKAAFLCQAVKLRQNLLLLHHTVVLQLDKEVFAAKQRGVFFCRLLSGGIVACGKLTRDLARKAGGERDQALVMRAQKLHIHARLAVKALGKAEGDKRDQIFIALLVLAKQHQVVCARLGTLEFFIA